MKIDQTSIVFKNANGDELALSYADGKLQITVVEQLCVNSSTISGFLIDEASYISQVAQFIDNAVELAFRYEGDKVDAEVAEYQKKLESEDEDGCECDFCKDTADEDEDEFEDEDDEDEDEFEDEDEDEDEV